MNPRHDGVVGCDRLDFALSSPPESDAGAARVVPLAGRGRQQGDAIGADLRRPAPAPRAPPAFLDSGMLGKRRVERTSDRGHTVLGAGLTETNHIALADRRGPRNALAVEKSAVATFQVGAQPALGDAPIQSGPAIGPYAALQAMALIEGLPVIHATQFGTRV